MDHECPFCRDDPFEYVDVGVGMVPAAVSCCDLGIELYSRNGDPRVKRIGRLLGSRDPRQVRRGKRCAARLHERFQYDDEGK